MKLSAVVVFYNPSNDNVLYINNYINCLDRLYIIDNSEDDIVRVKESDKIKYIKLGVNKGVAYALNYGAKLAISEGFNYLMTLDQDSMITPIIISGMTNYLLNNDSSKIGLVSPFHDIGSNDHPSKGNEKVLEVMTSGNIINLEAYKKVGGFKDWLFIDCVDTDYCMNLNKNGYDVIRLNDLIMKHPLGNMSIHNLFGKKFYCYNHSPIRRYYIVRNNLYIDKMYHDTFPEYCSWLLRVQRGQVKRILLFEKNKTKKISMMLKGYKDFKKGKKHEFMK